MKKVSEYIYIYIYIKRRQINLLLWILSELNSILMEDLHIEYV